MYPFESAYINISKIKARVKDKLTINQFCFYEPTVIDHQIIHLTLEKQKSNPT
ncbi:hypothetical protein FC51_GL002407 [Lentilactobacillus parabuchneri DSM 5707 = NBRC 107865]|uniref:Uncharacterized protein n=1 Tax=Lentilactobacillus parabuchneri DSM 5707 = NBRC 107865 TaxID=1423784 RepID=A0A0R1Z2R7_9LACO|nr:hypothetical protein FC51_GL002407 [Lentilactobacillus parabuchneri DSM 5707 = NBRC 107865]KRN80755.1 hypothetical protein IV42_GL002159 [Lentilactobacillus parabuchneri]